MDCDFTTLCDNLKVNSRKTLFTLKNNPVGMCTFRITLRWVATKVQLGITVMIFHDIIRIPIIIAIGGSCDKCFAVSLSHVLV